MLKKFKPLPRPFWVSVVVMLTIFAVASLLSIAGLGAAYYTKLPVDAYYSVNNSPWAQYNVSLYQANSIEKLETLEQNLTQQVKTSDDKFIPGLLLARYYKARGYFNKASKQFNRALVTLNNDWFSHYYYQHFEDEIHAELAALDYYVGNKKSALNHLKAIEKPQEFENNELIIALWQSLDSPDRGDFHFQLATELRSILQVEQAKKELVLAEQFTTDPTVKQEIKRYQQSKLPKYLESINADAKYFLLAGVFNETKRKNLKQADHYYRLVSQLEPELEWAYSQQSVVAYKQQRYSEALNAAYKSIAINPESLSPYLTLADVEIDRQNYTLAVAHYNKALILAPQYSGYENTALVANIQNQIGFAYEQLGARQEAILHYEQALATAAETSSDYHYSLTALERIKSI